VKRSAFATWAKAPTWMAKPVRARPGAPGTGRAVGGAAGGAGARGFLPQPPAARASVIAAAASAAAIRREPARAVRIVHTSVRPSFVA